MKYLSNQLTTFRFIKQYGDTPIDIAQNKGHHDLVALLR